MIVALPRLFSYFFVIVALPRLFSYPFFNVVVTPDFSGSLIFVSLLCWSTNELKNIIYIKKNDENRFDQFPKGGGYGRHFENLF